MTSYAANAPIDFPIWAELLFVAALAAVTITVVAIARSDQVHVKRRVYWVGMLSAVVCAAMSLLPLGTKATVIVGVGFAFAVIFRAYFSTPYLKVGGRILALNIADRVPDATRAKQGTPGSQKSSVASPNDSYGNVATPNTYWWMMVVLVTTVSAAIYLGGWIPQLAPAAVVLTLLGLPLGISDGSGRFRIARGQYVQAGIIVVASIFLWLGPPLAYLLGYQVGRVRPIGRNRGNG